MELHCSQPISAIQSRYLRIPLKVNGPNVLTKKLLPPALLLLVATGLMVKNLSQPIASVPQWTSPLMLTSSRCASQWTPPQLAQQVANGDKELLPQLSQLFQFPQLHCSQLSSAIQLLLPKIPLTPSGHSALPELMDHHAPNSPVASTLKVKN